MSAARSQSSRGGIKCTECGPHPGAPRNDGGNRFTAFDDDDDDDDDGDDGDDDAVERSFEAAAEFVAAQAGLSTRKQLLFYGLFKQATVGDAPSKAPFGPIRAAKWKAWNLRRGLSAADAEAAYVAAAAAASTTAASGAPPSVAAPPVPPADAPVWQGSAFQFAAKGDYRSVAYLASKNDAVRSIRDHRGRSLLHWGASSGSCALVEHVLAYGLPLDERDADGLAPLDHAIWCQHDAVAALLRANGATVAAEREPVASAALAAAAAAAFAVDEAGSEARSASSAAASPAATAEAAAAAPALTRDADSGEVLCVGDAALADGHSFWKRQPSVFGGVEAAASGTIQHMSRAVAGADPAPPCAELVWEESWTGAGRSGTCPDVATALPEVVALLRAEQVAEQAEMGSDGWRGGAECFQASLALSRRLLTTHWDSPRLGSCIAWRGLRVKATGQLVGFCAAVPQTVRIRDEVMDVIEINSLVVHPAWRGKRLTPALVQAMVLHGIDEYGENMQQAMHLCAVDLPIEPIATCQWHKRPLDAVRLVAAGQLAVPDWSTLTDVVREWDPPAPASSFRVRPLEERDVPSLTEHLATYLGRYELGAVMKEKEVRHRFMPTTTTGAAEVDSAAAPDRVVRTYVVVASDEEEKGAPSALLGVFSFYELSDRAAKGATPVRAAMAFYNASFAPPSSPSASQRRLDAVAVVSMAMHTARSIGCHAYYMLDALENGVALAPLRFRSCGADGALRYFVYNYALPEKIPPSGVGLVLM